ncbi:MAG: Hpt domain-containing protein [Thermodesulfobacteriota bacterium]|nr:Hpt domain-containing protein [Thermodesulfobacteriota bacterium]
MDRETYMQVIREHMKTSYLLKDDKINAILPRFLASLESHLQTLEEMEAEGDLSGLGVTGHKVKGALLNLGLFELADTASTIEQQAKQLDHDTDYPSLIAHLKHSITILTGG